MDRYKKIFLRNKANEIDDVQREYVLKYLPFYSEVSNDDLAYIFSYFHYKLNSLFQFLNHKMNVNHHYNADESRELIKLISDINQLKKELEKTKYKFEIDKHYKNYMEQCNNFLEGSRGSPIPENMKKIEIIESSPIFYMIKNYIPIEKNINFDEPYINTQWQKALERKISDPEGAITISRTLLESVLKYILDEKKIIYSDNTDLSELYKKVAKSLNLAPEQHQEQIFKQILGGANGVVSGLCSLRNKLGDAHGKGKIKVKPKERHSELAVNLSGTITLFLYKTFKEQCNA